MRVDKSLLSMANRSALDLALQIRLMPTAAFALRLRPLPTDVGLLLRVLARDPEAEAIAIESTDRPIEMIREAAEFYAVEILFFPKASAYRTLGSADGASRDELRAHMGLLLRWLHPDSGNSPENDVHYERVVRAWGLLASSERRRAYDQRMAKATERPTNEGTQIIARSPFFVTQSSKRPAQASHRLNARRRTIALGALLAIIGALAWIYFDHDS